MLLDIFYVQFGECAGDRPATMVTAEEESIQAITQLRIKTGLLLYVGYVYILRSSFCTPCVLGYQKRQPKNINKDCLEEKILRKLLTCSILKSRHKVPQNLPLSSRLDESKVLRKFKARRKVTHYNQQAK